MSSSPEFLQVEEEFDGFCEILKRENVKSFLEIGSKFGGSLRRAAMALPVGSKVVSVDLPNGTKLWNNTKPALIQTIKWLNDIGYNAHLIWGDSTDPKVVAQVEKLAPFDAIFIDADHRMKGVTADWKNYAHMGRIIGFHDIGWKRSTTWSGTRIDVPEFWNRIKKQYKHQEFLLCPTGKNNGIGVLWRS